jgi:hypothetical protein
MQGAGFTGFAGLGVAFLFSPGMKCKKAVDVLVV